MDWMLPPAFSTFAPDIDRIYYVILVLTAIAFVIVEAGLIWFVIKYRGRPDRKAYYTHGNATAEIVWTAVPAVTVVVLGIMSGPIWNKVKGRDSVPADAMPVGVRAQQFEWHVTYPGADGALGSADDFTVRNQLHVVVNRPTVVMLTAEDVIHSFFVPAFRLKQDAVPGMEIRVWFEPTQTGRFELACAELCGLGHYRMKAFVEVHTQEDYQRWLAEQTQAAATQ
ncbi:MAG TPA: cytochrome c oxidase subunit II [Gemmatimonadales bacterium]|nr:cytochrome c oxidase subunit II [Gemmatimonadales bacterium]